MGQGVDIGHIERGIYKRYLDHGLVDIGLGIVFLSVLVAGIIDSPWSSLCVSLPLIVMVFFPFTVLLLPCSYCAAFVSVKVFIFDV